MTDPTTITAYHAHIYYDPATRPAAEAIREQIAHLFPEVRLGRWHDQPVGPHPQGMYQLAFTPERLPSLLPWLMLNRHGLAVLVHPETGNDYRDHAEHAAWLGAVLKLNLEVLRSRA